MITLATLETATEQEVFDQVVSNLRRQGFKSYTPQEAGGLDSGACWYRLRNLKCAAGWLIGDSEYKLEMERHDWLSLISMDLVPSYHSNLIAALQRVHDRNDVSVWEESFRRVAKEFMLSYKGTQDENRV